MKSINKDKDNLLLCPCNPFYQEEIDIIIEKHKDILVKDLLDLLEVKEVVEKYNEWLADQ